jgi:nucleotide-binding universal stress UspA family protein
MISRILLPVEFSPRCRGAMEYARALACQFHSEIILLHVVIPLATTYGFPEAVAYSSAGDMGPERVEQARKDLDTFIGEELAGISFRRVVEEGDPASTIVEMAHTEQAGLIVMPTHGYGPFRRFLLGSVTAKVLHDARCPVCTGPHMEQVAIRKPIRFENVACALDLGDHSPAVLQWAAEFAGECGAKLTIIHAIAAAAARLGGFYFDPEWRVQMAKDARDRISSFQQQLHTKAEVSVEIGDVPEAVTTAAHALKADLLVIGRGRLTGVLGRLRTNAYAILRESHCPVAAI